MQFVLAGLIFSIAFVFRGCAAMIRAAHTAAAAVATHAGAATVAVSGHTHLPEAVVRNGIPFVNPGSAGHRRQNMAVALGRLVIDGKKIEPQLIELDV